VQRHDPPVREPLRPLREVRRRVQDDRRVLRRQLHAEAASRIVSTIRSRPSSFIRQATAPAEITYARSSAATEAVRQTTRLDGEAASTAAVAGAPWRPGIR